MNTQTQEALKMAYKAEETGNLQDLVDALSMLVEIVEALEQPAQWISVKDRMPEFVTVTNYEKSSDDVLILIDGKHVYIGSYIFDTWSKTNDFCMRDLDGGYEVVDDMEVTHWMPLPEAPKEQA